VFHLSYRTSFMSQNFIFIDVSTHSHIPCHCGALPNWALYNHSLGICFFLNENSSSWFQQYKLPVQYTLTQDASNSSTGGDPFESYIVTDVCIHNPENIKNWECITEKAHNCTVLLLHLQAKTYRSWYLIWNGFYDLYCTYILYFN
jgi:hypothetical protein